MAELSSWGPDTALRAALLGVLGAWIAWWLVALCIALVDRRVAARLGPPMLRAILVGGVMAASVAPARAEPAVTALDGLHLPTRPDSAPGEPARHEGPATADTAHVVAPGDCLWTIVKDRSPRADDAQIARDVARWHAANRDVIGPDPDLIAPGQRLVPPGAS